MGEFAWLLPLIGGALGWLWRHRRRRSAVAPTPGRLRRFGSLLSANVTLATERMEHQIAAGKSAEEIAQLRHQTTMLAEEVRRLTAELADIKALLAAALAGSSDSGSGSPESDPTRSSA